MLPLKGRGVRAEFLLTRKGLQELLRLSWGFGAGATTWQEH